jgi:hypothetical protein
MAQIPRRAADVIAALDVVVRVIKPVDTNPLAGQFAAPAQRGAE